MGPTTSQMIAPKRTVHARAIIGQGKTASGELVLVFESATGDAEALITPEGLVTDLYQLLAMAVGELGDKAGEGSLIPVSAFGLSRSLDGETFAIEVRTAGGAQLRLAVPRTELAGLADALQGALAIADDPYLGRH